ncbi:MAG: hypothetical protein CMN32_17435 [Saprospirales bacterium]|nr:hypothetical protein [Saprospirales bacterium]
MRTILLSIALLLFSFGLFGQQKMTVRGTVADSTGSPLSAATVVLLQAQDSVMSAFAITGNDGAFVLKRVAPGEYLLQVSYVGYDVLFQPLSLTGGQQEVDAGTLVLKEAATDLETVEVKAEHIPMRFKKDTLEYNADAFKTQPGAVVEDLLKKLPGVEVERDGSIKAQGENVRNVLVDGKEFFGNDPKIATKNLPADAVDKVQVFDKKSERAEFTGIEDGRDEKTINLQLKEDKKQGYFGKASVGGGAIYNPDGSYDLDRYRARFNVNSFSGKTQLSMIGLANNINEEGFGFEDYLQFMGGLSNFMTPGSGGRVEIDLDGPGFGPQSGLNNTQALGLNLNREFGKSAFGQKTKLNFSYFLNHIDNLTDKTTTSENVVEDETFSETSNLLRNSDNLNHRFSLTLRHELDSMQNLVLRSNLSVNDGSISSRSDRYAFNGFNSSSVMTDNSSDGKGLDFDSRLSYRRRFSKKGRSLVADASLGKKRTENDALRYSNNATQYDGNPLPFIDTLNQHQFFDNDEMSYGLSVSYSEPLGKKRYIELFLSRSNATNDTRRDFYDRLPGGGELLNDTLSTAFNRGYRYDRAQLNLTINRRKLNLTFGAALQQSVLEGQRNAENPLERSFTRVLPSLFLDYELGLSRNLNFEYRTSLREPSLEQLQPIVDNSDPLNIYIGNPDLRPEYRHDAGFHFMLFDQFSMTSLFASVNADYTQDPITNSTVISEDLSRITRPENTHEAYGLRSYLNFRTPLRFIGTNISLTYSANWRKRTLFINEIENRNTTRRHSLNLSFDNRKKEVVDARIGARVGFNKSAYSVSESLDRDYLDQSLFADLTLTPTEKWAFSSDFSYTIYPEESFGTEQTIALWNASIARNLTPNNRFQLKLVAYDLLNQNLDVNRSSQLNYIYEERTRSLGRHVMLNLSYNISGFRNGQEGGVTIDILDE